MILPNSLYKIWIGNMVESLIKSLLPSELVTMDRSSRIWIYTLDRSCTAEEKALVEQDIAAFIAVWTSHNRQLTGYGGLIDERIIILAVDESKANASGCSIDKSVHFLNVLGLKFGFDPFNRWIFGVLNEQGAITYYSREALRSAYVAGQIHDETWCLDNLVDQQEDLVKHWVKPFGQSWLKRVI